MKKIYATLFSIFVFLFSHAQVNYTFSAATATYTSITGTTATLSDLTGYGATEEGFVNNIPIGFDFNYNNGIHSTISASVNGFAYFGEITEEVTANGTYDNSLTNALSNLRPIIAPFWDDAKISSSNDISYATTGTAPNRIFTLQWNNMIFGYYDNPTPTPSLNMQVKLYESTGIIELAYFKINGGVLGSLASDGSGGASVGLTSTATGSGNFISISASSVAPDTSSTSETNSIQALPATNQIYRFTPTFTLPITFVDFAGKKINNAIQLSWTTLTESDNKGFQVERSADGAHFISLGFVPSLAVGGNSTAALQYHYTDISVVTTDNYYRFKQTDKQGKYTYSAVVYVKGTAASTVRLTRIYPNPAINYATVILESPVAGAATITIATQAGTIMQQQAATLVAGSNEVHINLSRLPAGIYLVKTSSKNSGTTKNIKIIKQ